MYCGGAGQQHHEQELRLPQKAASSPGQHLGSIDQLSLEKNDAASEARASTRRTPVSKADRGACVGSKRDKLIDFSFSPEGGIVSNESGRAGALHLVRGAAA